METEQQVQQNPMQNESNQATVTTRTNMPVILVVVGFVLVVLVGGYFFMTSQGSKPAPYTSSQPSPQAAKGLEEEINSIEVESNDPDFAEVDRDLQSL